MIVVTGGGGFIGSVLAAHLNEAGRADLVIVDRFGTGDKWRNIAKRDFCDIVPVEALPTWLERHGANVEAVFHLGANSSTFETDADEVIATNLNASIALWRWSSAAMSSPSRIAPRRWCGCGGRPAAPRSTASTIAAPAKRAAFST